MMEYGNATQVRDHQCHPVTTLIDYISVQVQTFCDLEIPCLGRGAGAASVLSDEAERRDAGVGEHACDPFDLTRDAEHKPGGAAVRLRPDG